MDDAELLRRLRERDEGAFAVILDAWSPGMLRLAPDLRQHRRLGRGGVAGHLAKRCGERESRTVPWSSVADGSDETTGPTVDPTRFQSAEERCVPAWNTMSPRRTARRRPEEGDRMECREFVELVTAFVEGDLDDSGKRRVRDHLALCGGCRRYLDQYRDTVRNLQGMTPEPVDATLRAGLLEQFRDSP